MPGESAGATRLTAMASIMWERDIAEVYDETYAATFDPAVLDPAVDVLVELAGQGRALELAIGTGRVGLPLAARGVEVCGIELSPHMVAQLRAKPGAAGIAVTVGDMTTARAAGAFSLVFLVRNTIMNVTTQREQVAVFANAAAHLEPGGCFVLEVIVPQIRRLPPGELGRVFEMQPGHVGIETFDDIVGSGHVVAPLDLRRRPPRPARRALPLRVAIGARPDGRARRAAPP